MPPPRLHPLPKAGAVILKDFRIEDASSLAPRVGQGETKPLKILQWNIERGYKLEGIIAELKKVDADVLALQEIDVGCARSDWEDTGERIAKELRMNYAFVCEFEELYSPLRSARSQGGGVHGNAILSRFDMSNVEAIEHRHQPVDWDDDAVSTALQEPRRGRRLSLVADVHTPQGTLVVFSAHLEVFTGIIGRLHQFSDLLRCSKERLSRGLSCQAIMGDLNTLGHGIARISPQHCNDSLRWRTLGYSEGQFWVDHVLSVRDPLHGRDVEDGGGSGSGKGAAPAGDGALPPRAQSLGRSKCLSLPWSCAHGPAAGCWAKRLRSERGPDPGVAYLNGACSSFVNKRLLDLGLPAEVCRDLLNPGFEDPFGPETPTLEPEFMKLWGYPLMNGKLDWMLLRRAGVVWKGLGNHDYSLSDHKWLAATIELQQRNS